MKLAGMVVKTSLLGLKSVGQQTDGESGQGQRKVLFGLTRERTEKSSRLDDDEISSEK